MVKENEIRIGNVFHHLERWSNMQGHDTLSEFDFIWTAAHWNYLAECVLFMEDFEPIQITTDKLLELGFTKGDYHTNWFSHVELNCHLVQFSDGEYVLEGVDDIRLSEGFRYVHQLQNIFYWLTFKELGTVLNGS